jgi:hypothetical protein
MHIGEEIEVAVQCSAVGVVSQDCSCRGADRLGTTVEECETRDEADKKSSAARPMIVNCTILVLGERTVVPSWRTAVVIEKLRLRFSECEGNKERTLDAGSCFRRVRVAWAMGWVRSERARKVRCPLPPASQKRG